MLSFSFRAGRRGRRGVGGLRSTCGLAPMILASWATEELLVFAVPICRLVLVWMPRGNATDLQI